jgi:putative molybdopterin biosynthesis protein
VFHRLVSLEEAYEVLSEYVRRRPAEVEEVDLANAYGRVLAEDVVALYDYPPFDRSEVDGYAVLSSDVAGADEERPAVLRAVGSVGIGEVPRFSLCSGECAEVSTGSMVPRGADAVVPVEYTKRVGDLVYVYRPVAPGENVAQAGSDVLAGDVLLTRGTVLGPVELALLASSGIARVRVYRRVRVGIVSIGDELVEPGRGLELGKVFDTNSYYLYSSVRELGAEPVLYGIVGDDEAALERVLRRALEECDIVITSGGTSAGVGDVTYRVVERLSGGALLFHGLKVRPGKPTFAAVVGGKLIVGLPGFPLSQMMIFNVLVRPILARLLGYTEPRTTVRATLAERVLGYLGVTRLVPVVLRRGPGGYVAYPLSYRSGSTSVLQVADGFVRVEGSVPFIEEGAEVEVFRLHTKGLADLVAIGSHDYLLSEVFRELSRSFTVKYVPVGSLAGLEAVAKGVADLGGVHVLDAESGEYNVPVVRKLGYGGRVALVVGYAREVGLVVARGNPKGITGLRDLLREDVVFVNRTRYSGIRVLVDTYLERLARELGTTFDELTRRIRGYYTEARTHSGVALSILSGRADVGVTLRYVAVRYGLDFIPLASERFDIAVNTQSLKKREVKLLIDYLRSDNFRKLVERFPGYRLTERTGELVVI